MSQIQRAAQPVPDEAAVNRLAPLVSQQPMRMLSGQGRVVLDNEGCQPQAGCKTCRFYLAREPFDPLWKVWVKLQPAADILLETIVNLEEIQRQFSLIFLNRLQVFP